MSADGLGNVYIEGSLDGDYHGLEDAFVARLIDTSVVPEPSGLLLLAMGLLVASCSRRRYP